METQGPGLLFYGRKGQTRRRECCLAAGCGALASAFAACCPHCTPAVTTCRGPGAESTDPERDHLDLGPGCAADRLCDSGQVAEPLCA